MGLYSLFEGLKDASSVGIGLFTMWKDALFKNDQDDVLSVSFIRTLDFCYRAIHQCLEGDAISALDYINQALVYADAWKGVAKTEPPWHKDYPPNSFPSDNDAWMMYGSAVGNLVDLAEEERRLISLRYEATHPDDEEDSKAIWDNREQCLLSRVRAIKICYEAAIFSWQNDPTIVYELMTTISCEIRVWQYLDAKINAE